MKTSASQATWTKVISSGSPADLDLHDAAKSTLPLLRSSMPTTLPPPRTNIFTPVRRSYSFGKLGQVTDVADGAAACSKIIGGMRFRWGEKKQGERYDKHR